MQHSRNPWAATAESVSWASRGTYEASVPPFIDDLPVSLDAAVEAAASEALADLARFDAETANGHSSTALLRIEALASSRIEHIVADARALALATTSDAALVHANAAATTQALTLAERFDATAFIETQATLLGAHAPEHTGRFRDTVVWIGGFGSTPHTAVFVPPRHDRIPDLIDDLVAFTDRIDINPYVQVAIAHAQFETIHPFPDGNGRTGRAFAHALMRRYGITRNVVAPISTGLLRGVRDYYDALNAYRDGDLNPIVAAFTRAAFTATHNGRVLAADLERIRHDWEDRVTARRHAAVWQALPVVVAHPAVTVNDLAARLGVAFTSAQRAINQMVDANILTPVRDQKRHRVWVANDVLTAIDAAGRSS